MAFDVSRYMEVSGHWIRTSIEHQILVILYTYVTHVRAGAVVHLISQQVQALLGTQFCKSYLKINFKLIFQVSKQFKFQVVNILCDTSNINKLLQ